MSNEDIKKNHHFVFQRYMEEWIDPSENAVWVLRNKKIISTSSTARIGFQKSFYKINSINENERKLLECFLETMIPEVRVQMKMIIDSFLLPVENRKEIARIKQYVERIYSSEENIPSDLIKIIKSAEYQISLQENNTLENFYCDIEGELANYIKRIKEEGISFYYELDADTKYLFLFDICVQMFRTKRLQERWAHSFKSALQQLNIAKLGIDINEVDLGNIVVFYFWYIQSGLAHSLVKADSSVVLLCNDSSVSFITADQPVINLKCNYQIEGEKVTELELYYPISPSRALLINRDSNATQLNISEEEARNYNNAIANASYQFMIANNKEILEEFLEI